MIILINNYLKCKWVESPNQKTKTGWMDTKKDPYMCCLQETHLKPRDTYRLNVMGWKNIFHANGDQKKAGVAILISDKNRLWNKGHEKRQRRTLHNDQRVNPRRRYNNYKYICTQHMQYVRQMLTSMKGEINSNTIIVGDFNTRPHTHG